MSEREYVDSEFDIRLFPDTALRVVARPIEEWDDREKGGRLARLVAGMGGVLATGSGVGLAAPQIGRARRVFVMLDTETEEGKHAVWAFFNPEIIDRSKETDVQTEGCLSLPGLGVDIERNLSVVLRVATAFGDTYEHELEGFNARIAQHEIDHLDAVLTIDHVPRERWGTMLDGWRHAAKVGEKFRMIP